MPSTIRRAALGAALLLALAAAGPSAAPAQGKDLQLPEMSVTATRSERALEKLPRNVTVITREDIQRLSPLTVTEVLKTVPGLVVRDYTGTGAVATVDLRGFGETAGQHVLVTVDGRRLNQIDLSGVDFTTIPVENIERIEVLHGPASVLYGDAAVGGVINIVTRQGEGPPSGRVEGLYGSHQRWGLKGHLGGSAGPWSYFASARQDSTDGYRENSETRLQNLTFSARRQAGESLSFLLDGGLNRANYSLPGALSQAQFDADRRQSVNPNDWAQNTDGNLRLQAAKDFGAAGKLTTDLSYRRRRAESVIWDQRDTDIGVWGLQPKHVWDSSLGGMASRLTLGADLYRWDMTTESRAENGPKTGEVDYTLYTLAPYALEELSLARGLVLTVGARWQRAEYDIDLMPVGAADASRSFGESQLAWTAGLAWNFAPGSKLYARAARTFRYPTVEEYVTYGQFSPLDPERGYNYEVGAEYSLPGGGRLSAAVYYLTLEDEIAFDPQTFLNENLDETAHAGVEASLWLPLGRWAALQAGLSYERAEFTGGPHDGNELPLVPEVSGSAGLHLGPWQGLGGFVRVNYVGQRPFAGDYQGEFEDLDAYTTVDAGASYTWDRLELFVNANNLLSEKYVTYAFAGPWGKAYYPEPEITVWGGAAYRF
jgi:iron complex outermembrane receptor protein